VRWDTFCQTCVFASGGICGSRSAFWCVQGMKRRCAIFHAQVGPVWIWQKARQNTLGQNCIFASGGICVSRSASMARNIDTLFFILGRDRYGCDKKRAGTRYAELVFLHPVGSAGHVMHSSASGARNINTLFFILGCWVGLVWIWQNARLDTLLETCVFTSSGICGSRSV
jgi:hypothetical protein